MKESHPRTEDFTIVGVNHWETTLPVRECFSINTDQKEQLLEAAYKQGIESLLLISTCNRTELFARYASQQELIRLLTSYTRGSLDDFHRYGFELSGEEAIRHLFKVSVGLNSQILGDLQVIQQVKYAYEFSSNRDMVDGPTHRLMQYVFRAHKRSRAETSLGQGAATTAYAAVQFARKKLGDLKDKSIVLVGAGKIGRVTAKNLLSLGATNITLVNRNIERAEDLGERFNMEATDISRLPELMVDADLVAVATGAEEPIITLEEMQPSARQPKYKVLLDLSVPRNIDPSIGKLEFVELANMDWLSDVTDEAYRKREENIPQVKAIIDEEFEEFQQWISEQRVVPTIKALTNKFDNIRQSEIDRFKNQIDDDDLEKVEHLTRRIVNKIAAHSIDHLREHHQSDQVTDIVEHMFKLEHGKDNGSG